MPMRNRTRPRAMGRPRTGGAMIAAQDIGAAPRNSENGPIRLRSDGAPPEDAETTPGSVRLRPLISISTKRDCASLDTQPDLSDAHRRLTVPEHTSVTPLSWRNNNPKGMQVAPSVAERSLRGANLLSLARFRLLPRFVLYVCINALLPQGRTASESGTSAQTARPAKWPNWGWRSTECSTN